MISAIARLRAKKGFTMIQMIVVMAIIGVLTAIIIPALSYSNKPSLGKAIAKDVYYKSQDILSSVEIAQPSALSADIMFYADIDAGGRVPAGACGVAVVDTSVTPVKLTKTTFEDMSKVAGTTDAQKKMYSMMAHYFESYLTNQDQMQGTLFVMADSDYRVDATYWIGNTGTDFITKLSYIDNCILESGDYSCSFPADLCDGGRTMFTLS